MQPSLQLVTEFEEDNPAFAGRMKWIRYRSQPVTRTRAGNGADRVVEELEPNGYASAFVKVAGRWYVDVEEFWRIVALENGKTPDEVL